MRGQARAPRLAAIAAAICAAVLLASPGPAAAINFQDYQDYQEMINLLEQGGYVVSGGSLLKKPTLADGSMYGYNAADTPSPTVKANAGPPGSPAKPGSVPGWSGGGADKVVDHTDDDLFYGLVPDIPNRPTDSIIRDKSSSIAAPDVDTEGSSPAGSSFYGFYGSDMGFYGKSDLAEWVASNSDNDWKKRFPDLSEVSDPHIREILRRLQKKFASSDNDDSKAGGGGGKHGSEFYGQTLSFYGYAASTESDSSEENSSGRAPSYYYTPPGGQMLSVSFGLTVTGYYYSQAELDALLYQIQASLQDAAVKLGVDKHLVMANISPPLQSAANTWAVNVEVVFDSNTNGVYQFAQMLRENVAYVFPVSDYTGAQVSDVKVSAYDAPTYAPEGGVPPGYAAQIGAADQPELEIPGIDAVVEPSDLQGLPPAGCVLDRFSLNGEASCCYAPFALDAKFECCEDKTGVDECGVCGGNSQTCGLTFTTRVAAPAGEDLSDVSGEAYNLFVQKYRQGIALLFSDFGLTSTDVEVVADVVSVQSGGGPLRRLLETVGEEEDGHKGRHLAQQELQTLDITATVEPRAELQLPLAAAAKNLFDQAAQQKAQYEDLQFLAVIEVIRSGVCFNGFCEIGEMADPLYPTSLAGTCPQDCPVTKQCPTPVQPLVGIPMTACAGSGNCNAQEGTCQCWTGYSGEACSVCAAGYAPSGPQCVPACPFTAAIGKLVVGDPETLCGNRGSCNVPSGACQCLPAYAGADCGQCTAGYFPKDGVCLMGVDQQSGTVASAASTDSSGGTKSNTVAIVVAVCVALAVMLVAAAVWAVLLRRKADREASEGSDLAVTISPKSDIGQQIGMLCVSHPVESLDLPSRQDPLHGGSVGPSDPLDRRMVETSFNPRATC